MSDLKLTKKSDSTAHGSGHWIRQRISAVIIVLFTLSLMILIYDISKALGKAEVIEILKRPHNIIISAIFFLSGLYHAVLGVQVIVEDYVHCERLKIFTLFVDANNFNHNSWRFYCSINIFDEHINVRI
jgi:succinate dehydrogenase / fumarate reductase membrane anchor subunit